MTPAGIRETGLDAQWRQLAQRLAHWALAQRRACYLPDIVAQDTVCMSLYQVGVPIHVLLKLLQNILEQCVVLSEAQGLGYIELGT